MILLREITIVCCEMRRTFSNRSISEFLYAKELDWKSRPCVLLHSAGSLLVGRTPEDSIVLKAKVKQLVEAGLRAEYLSACELLLKEPELLVGNDAGAVFLPDDCQLDAHRTVSYIEKVCYKMSSSYTNLSCEYFRNRRNLGEKLENKDWVDELEIKSRGRNIEWYSLKEICRWKNNPIEKHGER